MNILPVAIAMSDRLPASLDEGLAGHSVGEQKIDMQLSSNSAVSIESADAKSTTLDNYVMQHKEEFERVFRELEQGDIATRLQTTRHKVEELLAHLKERKDITKERLKRVSFQFEEKKRIYLSQWSETKRKEVVLAMRVIEERIDYSGEDFAMIASLFQFIQREALKITDTDILQVQIYANNAENSNVDGECVHVY